MTYDTFNELSIKARRELINGGIINFRCQINNNYINDWFVEKDLLIEKHKRFLNKKD
ncbi:hypothetical protein MYP_1038 [Sporocytophaga myxococcoides]|uniref:Uncharacterized protein n=1 Tax=Sporocytophaga myxococcoides TaxID=153721 RepID=A0A098LA94_9BACT|nr:hypothetical protein MYP_1038 [Sporocytophaga myxococcoides]